MTKSIAQELLDVVNDKDQVIGVKQRAEIHANGLMHRAVHIMVFNSAGEFFIQKRSMTKDECPGLWDTSTAGHLNSGETYLDCAIRELDEELGIRLPEAPQLLFKLAPTQRNGMEHSAIYCCTYDGEITLQSDEIDEGKWMDVTAMDRVVNDNLSGYTDVLADIWRRYRSK